MPSGEPVVGVAVNARHFVNRAIVGATTDLVGMPPKRKVACKRCHRAKKTCVGEEGEACERCVRLKVEDCDKATMPATPRSSASSNWGRGPLTPATSASSGLGRRVAESDAVWSPRDTVPTESGRSPASLDELQLTTPVVALPPLPGTEVLDLILGRYFNRLYETFPLTIKSPLLREIGQGRRIPTFFTVSVMLWSVRWDPDLPTIMGRDLRTLILQMLFNRLQAELLPAVEVVLAGYNAMVGQPYDRRFSPALDSLGHQYISLTVWVLQSFVHLLDGLISIPSADANVLSNFQNVVRLAMSVMRASRFGDEELYGRPVASPWASIPRNRVSYYSALLERGRRAWWGIVVIDNSFAAIHATDPVIPWEEFAGIKMSSTDVIYQALSGEIDGSETGGTNNASYWSTGRISRPDAKILPAGSVVVFEPLSTWSMGSSDTATSGSILMTSVMADGAFSPQTAAVRIAQINAQISRFRRLRITPWYTDPIRTYLIDHLASWYTEVPETFKAAEMILASVPRPIPAGVGTLVLLNLMYLSGLISLNAPAEEALWKGEADEGWIQSEACVQARIHADKVTDLITPLVLEAATVPQMGLPFFQYTVVRAGLIHFMTLKNLDMARSDVLALELVTTQLAIHAGALRKGQGSLGVGERASWWYDVWLSVTGLA